MGTVCAALWCRGNTCLSDVAKRGMTNLKLTVAIVASFAAFWGMFDQAIEEAPAECGWEPCGMHPFVQSHHGMAELVWKTVIMQM